MKLFPYSLVRVGGETFEKWEQLNVQELTSFNERLLTRLDEQQAKKDELCERLMDFIKSLEDSQAQNAVQNVRRDLFNDRKIKNNKIRKANEVLSKDLSEGLSSFLDEKGQQSQLIEEGEKIYGKVASENRQVLQRLIGGDSIRNGLVLSSRSLLERLHSYQKRDVNEFRKKELQTEISLLQYLTRIYAKTSPFSTFTNLSVAHNTSEGKGITLKHETAEPQVIGHIRLNNYLFKYLHDLFLSYEPLYQKLLVRNNPTIKKEDETYLYLTNNNNVEAFQRIPQNPVVEYIYELVSSDKKGIPFEQLVEDLLEAIDAEKDEIDEYVKQLISYGFLEYRLGVSGIDPDWDKALIKVLSPLTGIKHVAQLIAVLGELRELAEAYGEANWEERGNILQNAFDMFKKVCYQIHEEAGLPEDERKSREELIAIQKEKRKEAEKKKEEESEEQKPDEDPNNQEGEKKEEEVAFKKQSSTYFSFRPEQIFYEDTTRQLDAGVEEGQITNIIQKLQDVLQEVKVYGVGNAEIKNMTTYFLDKYGDNTAVDLLTFYEDYFKEFKKPEKEKAQKLREEQAKKAKEAAEGKESPEEEKKESKEENPVDPKVKAWEEDFLSQLEINGEGDVTVDIKTLTKLNEDHSIEASKKPKASYGSFIQLMESNGEVSAFVNSVFSGYGKMTSRFLHILDEKVTQTTREWNQQLVQEQEIYLENCDASYFNANLHPPLMPYEIWMPGGHNSLSEEKQLPILDFQVAVENGALKLIHQPTGKQAAVFDLGFQAHAGRSQLFQLLDKFSKANYVSAYPLLNLINNEFNKQQREKRTNGSEEQGQQYVSNSPRIVINDLIFQRKTWFVPKPLLPEKTSVDSAYDYYIKVVKWQKEHGLPNEVFVYVDPFRGAKSDPKQAKKLTRDDYKPQYIDFRQPLLVVLFEKLVQKTPVTMKVVEMLPSSEEMLRIDGERYVSEFVTQWYDQ